jgi:hypothetical protein
MANVIAYLSQAPIADSMVFVVEELLRVIQRLLD